MKTLATTPKTTSRFKLLLSLIASLLFSISLLAFRVWYSGSFDYVFLVWNLFLAFIPFAISTILVLHEESIKSFLVLLMLIAFWLLFFPNAPYILTDLFHWQTKGYVSLWYDLTMILSFGWNGLVLGFISLADVQRVLTKRFSPLFGWASVICVLILSSFGIYLGRYLRWNSWDIFINPRGLAHDILERILNPIIHLEVWAMTIVFSVFLALCYLPLKYFPTVTDST